MGENFRDRGPFCVVLKGIPQQLSESEVLQAVEKFKPLHTKALPDSRWIVSLKTKQDAEEAQRTAQCRFSYDQHEFTFDIIACEKNQIPEEWIQSEKVDDNVDDLYGDQPMTIHAAQTCGYRSGIIQSVQTKTSSVFFSTSPEKYLLQVQHSTHHGFQQNPSSYIHTMTGHQFGPSLQQSPYQSGQFYSQYSIQAPLSRRIKVSCLPQGIKPDVLEMFFETVLDGKYIKELSLNPDSSAAIIEFIDPSVTDRVLQRPPLTLKGKQLKIELYTESDENEKQFDNTSENDDISKTTVEVTGFSKELTKDILELYFESEKRSGGGPIRNIELKEEVCLITFETEAATNAVLERSHKLSEMKLDVRRYIPPKSVALYEDRMLITGPHEKITEDYLTIFLEFVGGILPKEILYSEEDEEKALVIFETPPDLKRLIESCRMKKQQGARLEFSLVPISRCILVTNITPNISEEMVMMYFETTKRSGGGSVENVEMIEEGTYLVYFEDDSVIESVISRHHKLGNSQLQVQLFYPCIGRTASAENSRKFQNPDPVDYKVNLHICLFLKQKPNVKAWVEQEMVTVHGRLIIPPENSDTLTVISTLTSEMEGVKKLAKMWKGNAVQKLEECIKQVNCMEYEVAPDLWDSILVALGKIQITDENKVTVFTDKKHNIIRVVGFKDMVDQTSHNLKQIIDDEEKELEIKKQRTFYRKNLSKQEIFFLSAVNFPDSIHKRYSNVKCTFEQENMIVFEGTITDVKQAESFMDKTLKSIKKASLPNYSRNKLQLLSMKETDTYVRNKLEERNCLGIWEIGDECLIVWDNSDMKVNESIQIIKNCLVEKSLQITSEQQLILNSDVCTLKLAEVRRQYQGYLTINEDALNGTVEITTTDQYIGEIINIVQDFLHVNAPCSEAIDVEPCKVRYIKRWKKLKIENICKIHMVTIHFKASVEIQGTQDSVNKARISLSELLKGVLYKKKIFDLPGICKYICSEDGEKLIKQIEEENKCTINKSVEEYKKSATSAGKEYKKYPVEQLSCRMPGGPTIFVIDGDITDLDTEMLVIGCNKALDHSAGLAKRVVEKGGSVIQRECLQSADCPLREGDVVYINGGKLKCKIVAHAISPIWHGGTENEESLLKQVIIKCLDETDHRKFTSIGIPAIGTEIFGYPVLDASHTIVKTLKQYFETKRSTSVKNVFLCDLNIQHVKAFIAAVKMLFPPAVLIINQDAGQAGADVSVQIKSGRSGTSSGYSSPRITVVKGELADQKADVLVNTTASNLILSQGGVSASLLKTGGQKLQHECTQKYPSGIKLGDIAITGPGNLRCVYVFHGTLPEWHQDGSSLAILRTFMYNCLKEANTLKMTSVAFPALGTGTRKYPRDVVAREMFNCISEFHTKNPDTSLVTVYFVVYEKDIATLEAFEEEEDRRKQFFTSPTRHVGHADFQTNKWQAPLSGSSFPKITVVKGELANQKVDILVNTASSCLNLSQGSVSASLLKAGGQQLQSECTKKYPKGIEPGEIAITGPGNLMCIHVFHGNLPVWQEDGSSLEILRTFMYNCLKEANILKKKSIAFPALGTGSLKYPRDVVAREMFKCIYVFHTKNPDTSLAAVYLVVYEKDVATLEAFDKEQEDFMKRFFAPSTRHVGHADIQKKLLHAQFRDHVEPINEKRLIVEVYADSETTIDKALKHLESKCSTELKSDQIVDDVITRMSKDQVSTIEQLGKTYSVMIKADTIIGHIRLEGLPLDVANVKSEVYKEFMEVKKMEFKEKETEMLFNLVQWYYIEVTLYEEKLCPYNKELNARIEEAYKCKQKRLNFQEESGETYIIDLDSLEEYPENSKDPADRVKVLRKDKLQDPGSTCIPDSWEAMDKENLRITALPSTSAEYDYVASCFKATVNKEKKKAKFSITKIERIQNKILYTQYYARKKHMEGKNPRIQNEMHLWHGTRRDAIDSINVHGFNRSFCGTANAKMYGDGVYFAKYSSFSARDAYSQPDPAGNKKMYLTKVLTGRYTKGKEGMRVPPPITSGQQELYDSVVDNETDPVIFVIFHDTQAYPEYLITFTCN